MKNSDKIDLNDFSKVEGHVGELNYEEFKELKAHFRRPALGIFESVTAFFSNAFSGRFFANLTVADPINGIFHTLDAGGNFVEDSEHKDVSFKNFFEKEKINGMSVNKALKECDDKLDVVDQMIDMGENFTAQDIIRGVFSTLIESKMLEYKLATDTAFAARVDGLLKFVGPEKAPSIFSKCTECLVFGDHEFEGQRLGVDISINHSYVEDRGIVEAETEYFVHDLVSVFGTKGVQDVLIRLHREKGVSLGIKNEKGDNIFHTMFKNMEQLTGGGNKSRDATEGFQRLLEAFKDEGPLYHLLVEKKQRW